MLTKRVTVPLLAAGAAACAAAFAVTRHKSRELARRRAAIAARLKADLRDEELESKQEDSEDLQWRPRIGSSLAGPEDMEPLELDFDEFEETDIASAAITVDITQQGEQREAAKPLAKGTSSNSQRLLDDLDWIDELEDEDRPSPHRYR